MNPQQTEAYQYLAKAQQARKAGDKRLARQYAEQAARLAPESEDVWLMMAALASPRASVVFMEKAMQISPDSERVRQGMHWAVERLKNEPPPIQMPNQVAPSAPEAEPVATAAPRRPIPWAMVLLTLMCLGIFGLTILTGPSMVKAASAAINNSLNSQHTPDSAIARIAKPTSAASPAFATDVPTLADLPTQMDTLPAVDEATATSVLDFPTDLPPVEVTAIAETATPLSLGDIFTPIPTDPASPTDDPANPTPTALPTDTALPQPTAYVPPTPSKSGGGGGSNTGRWIDVDLTHQTVYAYEGNTLVNSFIVSTGTWQHPTVTGQYHIYIKYRYKDMTGPGYYLPNVPFTMFFYQGYAIHGTYWHSNFGTPMSHGCVNLSIPDSEWMYNWASVGTLVNVHY